MAGKSVAPPTVAVHHPEVLGDAARTEFSEEATAPPDTTDHSWGGGVFGAAAAQPPEARGRPVEEKAHVVQAIRASARAEVAPAAEAEEGGGLGVVFAALGGAVVAIALGLAVLWGIGVL